MASRKVLERKRKDEEDAAHAFEEFIETFHQTNKPSKVWIKAGIYDASTREEMKLEVDNSLYKPSPRIQIESKQSVTQAQEFAKILVKRDDKKKKSNLESFKEELEKIHKDRQVRYKLTSEKTIAKFDDTVLPIISNDLQNSTNLYVNHLNPYVEERQLIELFGQYGPLASVKIMWPRTEEEKIRNKNCGFVAFMSRKDAERALVNLNGIDYMNSELKVGWGKPLATPKYPMYIPKVLQDILLPPPQSGLPFNAQPTKGTPTSTNKDILLQNCVVHVVVPTDKTVLFRIHRTIEFIIREGPMFEAMIMNKEITNPLFRFLFDNKCQEHVYYRWKLYSMLHGDTCKEWRTCDFRMFQDGSIWKPPIIPDYTKGIPDELFNTSKSLKDLKRTLSNAQRDHLENIIHKLTPERNSIATAMVFCVEHIEAFEEIAGTIVESLESASTAKKIISRLYLVTDICHNVCINYNIYLFKQLCQDNFEEIFRNISKKCETFNPKEKKLLQFKVLNLLEKWEMTKLFEEECLKPLKKYFETSINEKVSDPEIYEPVWSCTSNNEIVVADSIEPKIKPVLKFVPSRWETVEPEILESQAVTTQKWNQLVHQDKPSEQKTKILSETERKKLREIEVKVVEYQDRLESGSEYLESCFKIAEQVEDYRQRLLKKYDRDFRRKKSKRSK